MSLGPEETAALIAAIATIAAAGAKGVWVWGRELRAVQRDRDWWRDAYIKAADHADQALAIAEPLATKGDG